MASFEHNPCQSVRNNTHVDSLMDIQSRAVNLMKWSANEQFALPDVTHGQQVPPCVSRHLSTQNSCPSPCPQQLRPLSGTAVYLFL